VPTESLVNKWFSRQPSMSKTIKIPTGGIFCCILFTSTRELLPNTLGFDKQIEIASENQDGVDATCIVAAIKCRLRNGATDIGKFPSHKRTNIPYYYGEFVGMKRAHHRNLCCRSE